MSPNLEERVAYTANIHGDQYGSLTGGSHTTSRDSYTDDNYTSSLLNYDCKIKSYAWIYSKMTEMITLSGNYIHKGMSFATYKGTTAATYILYDNWNGTETSGTGLPWYGAPVPILAASERLREIIRQRQAPAILTRRRRPLAAPPDIREIRARETLRQVIGETEFRSFLCNGFITVRAKSGLVYQIFPGHDITQVYDHGKMVERLCVCLKGNFPATDELIMRYLMILNNEDEFRSHANSHRVSNHERTQPTIELRSLPEIFAELKAA